MFRRRRIQSAADPSGHSAHAVSRLQPVEDVYLLFLNRPPDDVPADDGGATVVPAASLHHPELPQPDAQRLYDRVTCHPARHPGALVFLSDLTAELASVGSSWSQVGIDYEAVTDRLVALHHRGQVPGRPDPTLRQLSPANRRSGRSFDALDCIGAGASATSSGELGSLTPTSPRSNVGTSGGQMSRSSGPSASCTPSTFRGSPCGQATLTHIPQNPVRRWPCSRFGR
jgi:hypothetical protein